MAVVGAIRWDAWYSITPGSVSSGAQQVLGKTEFRARLPWFYQIENNTQVVTNGGQQEIDLECLWAHEAGINFWAFNEYVIGFDSDLRVGWNLYNSSSNKSLMNWCWISDLSNLGSFSSYATQVAGYVTNFSDPQYQVVLTNRPIWFIIWDQSKFVNSWGSSYANVATAITALRAACSSASIGDPYIVLMDLPSLTHPMINITNEMSEVGFDALSFYSVGGYGSYTSMVGNVEGVWNSYLQTDLNFIPTACVGWSPIPFIITPESWYGTGSETVNQYTAEATIPQLMSHFQDGLNILTNNPVQCNSEVLLIYAWNECAEGGVNMLIPTWENPPPSPLLTALGAKLNG